MLLGPADIGMYLGLDVDAWVLLGLAAVDIEVPTGCIDGLGWLDGGSGLTA